MDLDRRAVIEAVKGQMEFLRTDYHVKSLALFGSVAKGVSTQSSDVDMLVEFSQPIGFFKFIELENLLSHLIERKVDLVTKAALKPLMRDEVEQSLERI
jgi:predicted nucleotidyltransferase